MQLKHLGFLILENGNIEYFGKTIDEDTINFDIEDISHILSIRKLLKEKFQIVLPENITIAEVMKIVLEKGFCIYLNTEGEKYNRYGSFYYDKNITTEQKATVKKLYNFFNSVENLEISYGNKQYDIRSIYDMYQSLQIYDYELEYNFETEESYDIFKNYTGDWQGNTKRSI